MAKAQNEYCLWCGEVPCSCNTPPKTTKRNLARPALSVPAIQSVPQLTPVDQALRRTGLKPQNKNSDGETDPRDEIEERLALTVLCRSGLVHWSDVERLAPRLNISPSEIRILVWKAKRAEVQQEE